VDITSDVSLDLAIGQKVTHPELGEGVVIGLEPTGFLRIFFRSFGERQVPLELLKDTRSWNDRVIGGLKPSTPEKLGRLWLAIEAAELPLMENAATLTSAKVDLLPHQVVLVHRIANAQPRRFLIADEVGLGKTIETALILRELASRGALNRAIMIVPAGLVENWRHELNDVFNLDYEVFGSEGDISDRKSNAFAKHNRIIASIDTLKRPSRIKRLLEAPSWDLVVFDEAHHLSAYKNGSRSKKTENFKLAEALKGHCRDLLLLSATPHQGDNFRFWMLIRLLDSTLFEDEKDMTDNRHRLNAVVIRRTKADSCASDGSSLFSRRVVQTEGFTLSQYENAFYQALLDYLRDGYNLAALQGNQGRALGFIMTIFQKIAASSFAAVKATLQRRLLMLTVQEAIERDGILDVDGRNQILAEAAEIIRKMHGLNDDPFGRAQAEQLLAEAKVKLLKKHPDIASYVASAELSDGEDAALAGEESAASMVSIALPEERRRIRELLEKIPNQTETKIRVLLGALNQLWQINPKEKVVIFATYLGSVESVKKAIGDAFPGKGIEILKGGDHGAKIAAQKRFKRLDGPQVLVTTAAGREGINLQSARILFNYDLPWNPMDLEQRIGRIHRYGQKHTAQVYNLIATDTIEGKIFLLLEEKLQDIANTLGKVDENGQVTEDLRIQILGQLNSRLSYDQLYQEAVRDPSLKRTRQEIEVAMENANMAREVVFELFQDLEKFNLGDFKRYDDEGRAMNRLVSFVKYASKLDGAEFKFRQEDIYELILPGKQALQFTTDRDKALEREELNLLGLEHPIVKEWLNRYLSMVPEDRGLIGCFEENDKSAGLITIWQVSIQGQGGQSYQRIVRLGIGPNGERSVHLERLSKDLLKFKPSKYVDFKKEQPIELFNGHASEILHRELIHSGTLPDGASYSSSLLACINVLDNN
jgi:SNF2 family DNA or RNA helicase